MAQLLKIKIIANVILGALKPSTSDCPASVRATNGNAHNAEKEPKSIIKEFGKKEIVNRWKYVSDNKHETNRKKVADKFIDVESIAKIWSKASKNIRAIAK